MTGDVHIETPRLVLRTLVAADATDTYCSWLNDAQVNRFLESRFETHTPESVRRFIAGLGSDNVATAIIERSSDEHVGNIKLGPIHPVHRTADIGILIGAAHCWGRGYATEAIVAMTDHAFGTLGLAKVTASAYARNVGSIRAFERAGFDIEGRRRSQVVDGDERDDVVMLGTVNPRPALR